MLLLSVNTILICDSITELSNQQTVGCDTGLVSAVVWTHHKQLRWISQQKEANSETCSSHSVCFTALKPHTWRPTIPPSASTSPTFQLQWQVALGGLGASTAAQKSPTGVLLTGCPLSSVPIGPWPSPHLGRCSEGSTGGRWADTLQNLKCYVTNNYIMRYVFNDLGLKKQISLSSKTKNRLTGKSSVLFTLKNMHEQNIY